MPGVPPKRAEYCPEGDKRMVVFPGSGIWIVPAVTGIIQIGNARRTIQTAIHPAEGLSSQLWHDCTPGIRAGFWTISISSSILPVDSETPAETRGRRTLQSYGCGNIPAHIKRKFFCEIIYLLELFLRIRMPSYTAGGNFRCIRAHASPHPGIGGLEHISGTPPLPRYCIASGLFSHPDRCSCTRAYRMSQFLDRNTGTLQKMECRKPYYGIYTPM